MKNRVISRSTLVTDDHGVVVASIGVENHASFAEQANLHTQGFNLEKDHTSEDRTDSSSSKTYFRSKTILKRIPSIRVPSINLTQQHPQINPTRELSNLRLMERINPAFFTQNDGVEVSAELAVLKPDPDKTKTDEIQLASDEVKTVRASAQDEIQQAPDEVRKVQTLAQDEIQQAPIQPAPIQPASAQIAKGQKVSVQPARAQILSNCTSCCCTGILNYFFYSRRIHPDNSPEIIGAGSLSNYKAKVEIV